MFKEEEITFYRLDFPPALHKIFDEKARTAFIDLANQIDLAKRYDYALSRESHLQAFRDLIARRFAASTEENKQALQEAKEGLHEMLEEYKRDNSQRLAEAETMSASAALQISPTFPGFFENEDIRDKWFREIITWLDKRFDEFEARFDELHAILMKYLFSATLIYLSQR